MWSFARELGTLAIPPGRPRLSLTAGLLCTFGAGLATLLLPELAGRITAAFPAPSITLLGALCLALIGRCLLGFVGAYCLGMATARTVTELRRSLFERLLHAPLAFHHQRWSVDLATALTADTAMIEQLLQALLPSVAQSLPLALIAALALLATNPTLTLGLALTGLPMLALVWMAGRALRRVAHVGQVQLGALAVAAQESLRATWLVKSLGREPFFVARVATMAMQLLALKRQRVFWQATLDGVLPVGATLALLGGALIVRGQLASGAVGVDRLAVYGGYLLILGAALFQLVRAYTGFAQMLGSAGRLRELWAASVERDVRPGTVVAPGPGAISIEGLSFAYPAGHGGIFDASLAIAPGEMVGIVGPNGAGKSTLIALLLGLYPAQRGVIRLDGLAQAEADLASWRRQFGLVTRDPVVFCLSLADNIALGRVGADQAAIEQAARSVGMHEFICGLPTGYATNVGEGGVQLSAGQRQRIALARLLLQDPAVVVLDEATLSLDAEAEAAMASVLQAWSGRRIVFIIAHQSEIAWPITRLVRLEGGRIVADHAVAAAQEHTCD